MNARRAILVSVDLPSVRRLIAVREDTPLTVRRNVDIFEDAHGVKRPIRGSEGYDESLVGHRAAQRERSGFTAADQQTDRQFDKAIEKSQWLTL